MSLPRSSLHDVDTRTPPHALWVRRGFVLVLAAFVAAGLSGVLGVRTATTTATSEDWRLELRHAAVARAGLDVPWEVTIEHVGGFTDDVVLSVTGDYLDIYETQGFAPEPVEMVRDGSTLYLTFAPPPAGETFVVSYDAYIQPASQRGAKATLSVLDGDVPVVSLDFETRLLP
ncbi:hypothetical protein [Nocardioides ferulae]|uniref:hypothetical protein n=1 Tax=Nocardioides ferulae TaxID=2340821 RepID=UPI000EAB975B|nr:hypothetical protein [Nocardioides ferulae]